MAAATVEAVVVIGFQGQQEDELTLKVGDIVKHVKKGAEDGWLEGELDGKKGCFPSQFVKEIPASLMWDGNKKYPRSIRKAKVKTQQRWCKAEYSYTPENMDELELTAGDIVEVIEEIEDGWWLGKKGVLVGAFPSNFVQKCAAPTAAKVVESTKNNKQRVKLTEATFHANGQEKPPQENTSAKTSHKAAVKEYCKVMFDYVPTNKDELALKSGQVILILRKDTEDEGWWEGELNGKTGLFPDNFVMVLSPASHVETDKPPVRKLTMKGAVRPVITVSDKTPADGSKPQNQPLKDQKGIKPEMTTAEKKTANGVKPPSQPLKDQKIKSDASVPEKKTPESSKPQTQPLKDQKDPKDAKMDQANKVIHPALKKAAPPPPIPLKTRTSFKALDKHDGIFESKPAEVVKEIAKEADASHFDALNVSMSKLSHPTAERPKMQGKRPPTHINQSPVEPEHPAPTSAKVSVHPLPVVVSPSPPQAKKATPTKAGPGTASPEGKHRSDPEPGDRVTAVELKSEIHAMKVLMETTKKQYERDMASIKAELKEERDERLLLQIELEKVKKFVPS